ncbi:MAG: PH domain-containing protein [Candidatus Gracilibacteria bacterium]
MADVFPQQPEGIIMLRESKFFLMTRIFFLEVVMGLIHVFFRFILNLTGLLTQNVAEGISFYLIYIFFIQIVNAMILVYILFKWMNKYYVINLKEITVHEGLFKKRQANYSLATVDHITLSQGLFARLMNYGTVKLFDSANQQRVNISGITNPAYYLEAITKVRNAAAFGPAAGI